MPFWEAGPVSAALSDPYTRQADTTGRKVVNLYWCVNWRDNQLGDDPSQLLLLSLPSVCRAEVHSCMCHKVDRMLPSQSGSRLSPGQRTPSWHLQVSPHLYDAGSGRA